MLRRLGRQALNLRLTAPPVPTAAAAWDNSIVATRQKLGLSPVCPLVGHQRSHLAPLGTRHAHIFRGAAVCQAPAAAAPKTQRPDVTRQTLAQWARAAAGSPTTAALHCCGFAARRGAEPRVGIESGRLKREQTENQISSFRSSRGHEALICVLRVECGWLRAGNEPPYVGCYLYPADATFRSWPESLLAN